MKLIKTRPRYRCDYCRYSSSSVPGMEAHERMCWGNPNRHCDLCGNTGKWENIHDEGSMVGDYLSPPLTSWEPCYYCSQFDPAKAPNQEAIRVRLHSSLPTTPGRDTLSMPKDTR